MLMAGMFSGVLLTGLVFNPLEHFYMSTSRGSLTLPQLLHVPYGVVVAAIVCIAFVGFRVAEAVEARSSNAVGRHP